MEQITLVFEPIDEGGFSVYVAEVPGANSQGDTIEEARFMVLEALRDLMAYRREKAIRSAAPGAVWESCEQAR